MLQAWLSIGYIVLLAILVLAFIGRRLPSNLRVRREAQDQTLPSAGEAVLSLGSLAFSLGCGSCCDELGKAT
jgi:hypothetical protein